VYQLTKLYVYNWREVRNCGGEFAFVVHRLVDPLNLVIWNQV